MRTIPKGARPYVVDLPYAYYRIEVLNGKIIFAAPIAYWARGKTLRYFNRWVRSKKGTIRPL